jgi:putative endonuclease
MASIYILYSKKINKYYIGSCLNLEERIAEHLNKKFSDSFTSKADDWEVFYSINNLGYNQSRSIEANIKRMKSKKYIENLKKYNEMAKGLVEKYSES